MQSKDYTAQVPLSHVFAIDLPKYDLGYFLKRNR